MFRPLLLAASALAVTLAPVAARAAPVRTPALTQGQDEQLVGLLWSYLILPAIVGAVLLLLVGGEDELDLPHSP